MPLFSKRRWLLYTALACAFGLVLMLLAYVNTPRSSEIIAATTATPVPATIVVLQATAMPEPKQSTPPLTVRLQGVATVPPTQDLVQNTLNDISANTQAISIYDNFDIPYDWRQMQYTLHRTSTGFMGQGTFRSPHFPFPEGVTRDIAFSTIDGQKFLQRLAEVIVEGEGDSSVLNPDLTAPAYTNSVTITLQTPKGIARFFMPYYSALNGNKTWRVEYRGRRFETYSYEVFRAYDILRQYLQQDVFHQ